MERNRAMALRVLAGETCVAVAAEYRLTPTAVQQAVHKLVKLAAPSAYRAAGRKDSLKWSPWVESVEFRPRVETLRRYRRLFSKAVDEVRPPPLPPTIASFEAVAGMISEEA